MLLRHHRAHYYIGGAGEGTGGHGSGGHGSQTTGTIWGIRHRRGRRGFLVNPWTLLRDWWRDR